ncbi:hypothetical protein A6J39_010185 [Legionella anisa]|uniref:Uncharacterized protein n=1 Tax=Legionella anisa TaxID=28082 RepID=A0AAX0WT47_9GAMM|nr:hypothetical protein DLD14_12280 [Legionella anisa]PNL61544.1 hypothetical protein A6J39_010185 [Legionella anisa]
MDFWLWLQSGFCSRKLFFEREKLLNHMDVTINQCSLFVSKLFQKKKDILNLLNSPKTSSYIFFCLFILRGGV